MRKNILLKIKRHGVASTAYFAGIKALNKAIDVRILRGVFVARADPAFLACPKKYEGRLLTEAELRGYARDPASELSDAFLDDALERGDQCYAILDRGRLASYGWYASGPTPIGLPGLLLHYRRGYVYMYKGYTHCDYRGQRLHAIGMTRALRHYLAHGRKGIVSYVDSTNFDSLKSCFRMGYRVFGNVTIVKMFGQYLAAADRGCAEFDFRVESAVAGRDPAGALENLLQRALVGFRG